MSAIHAGCKTYENLKKALAMEALARTKYSIFASRARKDGFEQIAAIFEKAAGNEFEHAKLWFKELYGTLDTIDALSLAMETEKNEWSVVYKEFASTADSEGFHDLADRFRRIAFIEMHHEDVFKTLWNNLNSDKVFEKNDSAVWECRNCGFIVTGTQAPKECPACDHPQAYFELSSTNF